MKMSLLPFHPYEIQINMQNDTATTPQIRRVVIIGGGIAGLSIALALSHLNKQQTEFQWEVYIFESGDYNNIADPYYILHKSGIKSLMELGIGKRLGAIGIPITKMKSTDPVSEDVFVDWPTSEVKTDIEADIDGISLPSMYRKTK